MSNLNGQTAARKCAPVSHQRLTGARARYVVIISERVIIHVASRSAEQVPACASRAPQRRAALSVQVVPDAVRVTDG